MHYIVCNAREEYYYTLWFGVGENVMNIHILILKISHI